jgi:translation elongation factor EF-1alpha
MYFNTSPNNYINQLLTNCVLRLRMPLIDKFRDMGTVVMGKIESGTVRRGDNLVVMPNKVSQITHAYSQSFS